MLLPIAVVQEDWSNLMLDSLSPPLLFPALFSIYKKSVDKQKKFTLYISGFVMTARPRKELGFSKGTSTSGWVSSLNSDEEGVNEEMIFHSLQA